MGQTGYIHILLLLIILCYLLLIILIRFSPQEITRSLSSSSYSLNKFRIIDLPFTTYSPQKEAATKVKNNPTKQEMPLTQIFNTNAGDPKAIPKVVYHHRFDYSPFVVPPPIRLNSMTFHPFPEYSEYYRKLLAPSRLCKEAICQNPIKYLNQYAKWDCQKHPSLCSKPGDVLVMFEPKYLSGDLDIIENGIVNKQYDCGWPANHQTSLDEPSNQQPYGHFKGSLAFVNVPQGFSFQHFLDGVLPKLVQLHEVITNYTDVYYAFDFSFVDDLPRQLCERLGIPSNRIIDYQSLPWINGYVKADKLVLACRVPPLHPELWMKAQELLKLPWLKESWVQKRHIILYFSRNEGTRNNERRVLNEQEVTKTIASFAKENNFEFVIFHPSEFKNLDELFDFLANVDIVIGPHGGAFYNIIFMRRDIKVIELMPNTSSFASMNNAVHLIIYLQSMLLGNNYYNIQGQTSGVFDMTINCNILYDTLKDSIL